MTERPSAWARFRGLPTWAQVLVWLFLWPVPTALYAASRSPGTRKPWWALTAVVALAWAGVAATSGQGQEPKRTEQAGKVEDTTTSTAAPETTTSTAADTSTSTTTAPGLGTSVTNTQPTPKGGSPATTTTTRTPPPASPSGDGSTLLAQLRVAPEGPRAGYDRDLFPHWIDADGDRCDAREEVLIAESRTPAQVDPYGCKVVAGDWFSIYDGVTTNQPGELDIDHVVALAEAWDSGASGWDVNRRREFANDLGYDRSLIAVTGSSNRSKSDQDPAEWMPVRRDAWCQFASDWVAVKVRWDLSADQPEVTALRAALGACGGSPSTAPPPAPAPTTTTTTAPPPPASGGSITVTALDCGGERVTVANAGSVAVDMTGWTIHDEGTKHTFTFPAGYTLTPGASVAVKSAGAAGPGELYWTGASVWNNDGDTAHLVDAGAAVQSTRSC